MTHPLRIDTGHTDIHTQTDLKRRDEKRDIEERSVENVLVISYTNTINLRLSDRSFVLRICSVDSLPFLYLNTSTCNGSFLDLCHSLLLLFFTMLPRRICMNVSVCMNVCVYFACWLLLVRFRVLFHLSFLFPSLLQLISHFLLPFSFISYNFTNKMLTLLLLFKFAIFCIALCFI